MLVHARFYLLIRGCGFALSHPALFANLRGMPQAMQSTEMIVDEELEWQDARDMCRTYGAELMTINNTCTSDVICQYLTDIGAADNPSTQAYCHMLQDNASYLQTKTVVGNVINY